MQPIPTIGVLVFRNNLQEVLLVKHGEKAGAETGIYGLPAGRIEEGESAIEATVRELKEETGLKATQENLIELPYDFGVNELKRKSGTLICTWQVFVCEEFTGELRGSGETTPEWIKVFDVSKLWLLNNIQTAVLEGLKFLN